MFPDGRHKPKRNPQDLSTLDQGSDRIGWTKFSGKPGLNKGLDDTKG